MGSAIEVADLRKRYGHSWAVDGVSFTVATGELVAILGHNGAGKTTTVEILEGHRRRDGGDAKVLGFDPENGGSRFRQRIGIVLQEAGLGPTVKVGEALELFATFWPEPRPSEELLEVVGLAAKRRARVGSLSGGERRRLDLALGLVGRPELLFLDEPTTGFDPVARREAWALIRGLAEGGTTVLLTTHYMEEAEHLADRALVLARGRLVAEGSPRELSATLSARAVIGFRMPPATGIADLPQGLGHLRAVGPEVELHTDRPTEGLHVLTAWALDRGVELEALTVTRPSLEDVYFELAVGDHTTNGSRRDVE